MKQRTDRTSFIWHECKRQEQSGSSSKKVSLLACEQEDDQQADGEEQSRRIKDAKKEVFRRDAGHAAVRGQNWRDRTSVVFAVLSS
jgi:hypothetical protein